MVITSIGYYYSGSGAITDLMKEFDNVYVNDRFELRLAHDPDGLSDLEYYLVDNPNRHNESTAIKRFIRLADKLDHVFLINRYNEKIDPDFLKHTAEYVEKIVILKFPGYYHYDIWEKSKFAYILNAVLKKLTRSKKTILGKEEFNYCGTFDEELFLEATRDYTSKILNGYNTQKNEDLFFEQLVPTSNIERYIRYFENIKVISVVRDPRDVYCLGKYKLHDKVIPKKVDEFCKWYRWNREIANIRPYPDSVLQIAFEDLIYYYEKTISEIIDLLGFSKERHTKRGYYFKPSLSEKNTQLWNRFPQLRDECDEISERLNEYCYAFPYIAESTGGKLDFF